MNACTYSHPCYPNGNLLVNSNLIHTVKIGRYLHCVRHAVLLILINLHNIGGPPSNEQVANATGPLGDEQFRVSTLAKGTTSHCSSTIGGTVREYNHRLVNEYSHIMHRNLV